MQTDIRPPETGESRQNPGAPAHGFHRFRRLRRWLAALLVLALLAGLCFGAGVLWISRQNQPAEITADLLASRIQQAQQLVTVKYFYTNMGKFEDSTQFYGWRIPFSGKSFIVSYEGKISAGVDLGRATVKKEGQRVTVSLPQPEILSHEIDQDSLKVYDESRNIFNQISVQDYAQFSVDQQQAMEQKAIAGGLLEEAKGAAERALTGLLTALEQEEPWQIAFVYLP